MRAILALIIVGVVIVQTLRGESMDVLLGETLMITLAHYFTSRRLIKLPRDMLKRLEEEGQLEPERNPLYLPRHAVRVIIVLAFVGLAVHLARESRLADQALGTLGVVFAYFLGLIVSGFVRWRAQRGGGPGRPPIWWEDGKALLVIFVAAAFAVATITEQTSWMPDWYRNTTFGVILFYFGSR